MILRFRREQCLGREETQKLAREIFANRGKVIARHRHIATDVRGGCAGTSSNYTHSAEIGTISGECKILDLPEKILKDFTYGAGIAVPVKRKLVFKSATLSLISFLEFDEETRYSEADKILLWDFYEESLRSGSGIDIYVGSDTIHVPFVRMGVISEKGNRSFLEMYRTGELEKKFPTEIVAAKAKVEQDRQRTEDAWLTLR